MTIFAHSQGGLIVQETLATVKGDLAEEYGSADADRRMESLEIMSFGTAILGWPKGPKYEHFTNTADPVPAVILGAQTNFLEATFKDDDTHAKNYVFTQPYFNPIDAHGMDNTYLPYLEKTMGAPGCRCN